MLNKAALNRSLEGLKVCRGAPYINHLLFANDSLIFCKANNSFSNYLQSLLSTYAHASGQSINAEKTTIVFSKNMDGETKRGIMAAWGGNNVQKFEKYLDLPPTMGRSRKKAFAEIKTKLW